MMITLAQQEAMHNILNKMLHGINGNPGILHLQYGDKDLGISAEDGRFLRKAMEAAGLLTNSDAPGKNGLSTLTTLGFSIANSPGGYLAYLQHKKFERELQQLREQEQLDLARQGTTANVASAAAAVSSARSAKVSAWIAGGSLLVAIVAAYIAYLAIAGSNEADARLQKLEAQVQQLKVR